MKRIGTSLILALFFVGVLGFTAFSQQTASDEAAADEIEVQILEESIRQEIPVDITLLMSTTTGVQTVTVPIKLNINLTVGPIDAVDLAVEVQNASQFVSPLDAAADEAEDADAKDEDDDSSSDGDSDEDKENDEDTEKSDEQIKRGS